MSESIKLTTKLHKRCHEGIAYYIFWCPGCECGHVYCVGTGSRTTWNFNGDINKPTFTPSLLNHREGWRCHLFLTDGVINYCGDCTHSLAGLTVGMIDIPEDYGT